MIDQAVIRLIDISTIDFHDNLSSWKDLEEGIRIPDRILISRGEAELEDINLSTRVNAIIQDYLKRVDTVK